MTTVYDLSGIDSATLVKLRQEIEFQNERSRNDYREIVNNIYELDMRKAKLRKELIKINEIINQRQTYFEKIGNELRSRDE